MKTIVTAAAILALTCQANAGTLGRGTVVEFTQSDVKGCRIADDVDSYREASCDYLLPNVQWKVVNITSAYRYCLVDNSKTLSSEQEKESCVWVRMAPYY